MSGGPWCWRVIPTYAQTGADDEADFLTVMREARRALAAAGVHFGSELLDELAADRAAETDPARN